MNYKVTETIPPEYCRYELIERLKEQGLTKDGHIEQLKAIITENGFKLPTEHEGHYGFLFTPPGEKVTYTRLYLTFVDAIANEILMLREFKMI